MRIVRRAGNLMKYTTTTATLLFVAGSIILVGWGGNS